MEANATKRTDIFLIDPRNIVIMDNFNVRRDFDLDELKEQIKAKSVLNPITVIPFKEAGVEKYKLVDGERRYRATIQAIQEGASIQYIKALKAPRDSSMESLYVEQMMRNEGKRFTEYECAIMFHRFKVEYGYSQVEIADKFKKSPAFVSKCLSLLVLPEYIQTKIVGGELSAKAAREIASTYETEREQVRVAKSAVEAAVNQGKRQATNREVLEGLKSEREAKAVFDALRRICGYLEAGNTMVDVDLLATMIDETQDIDEAMTKYLQHGSN